MRSHSGRTAQPADTAAPQGQQAAQAQGLADSPALRAQGRRLQAIGASPRMALQRQRIAQCFGAGPVQRVVERYEISIRADRSGYGRRLTGHDARRWLIDQRGQGVIDRIKERYTLMYRGDQMMAVVLDGDEGRLRELLRQLNIANLVELEHDAPQQLPPVGGQPPALGVPGHDAVDLGGDGHEEPGHEEPGHEEPGLEQLDAVEEEEQPPDTLEGQIAYYNTRTMRAVNVGGTISYHYNVAPAELEELSQLLAEQGYEGTLADAATGYANPEYFDKTGEYTWVLRAGRSAAEAIEDFVNLAGESRVIAECQTTAQAVNYHTLLRIVGPERFDARFGRGDGQATSAENRLRLEKRMNRNPIERFFKTFSLDFDDEERAGLDDSGGDLVSAPNSRPAKVGGWYFIKNHDHYTKRHPQGFLMGENAFYYGRDGDGNQRFGGLGLENETELGILEVLAGAFNQPPSAAEVEKIYQARDDLRLPGIQLPELGNLDSVAGMPITAAAEDIIRARPGAIEDPDPHEVARALIEAQGAELVQPVDAQQLAGRTSRDELNHEAGQRIDASGPVGSGVHTGAVWDMEPTHVVMDRRGARSAKLSRHTAVDAYAKKFGLLNAGPWLSQRVKALNPAVFVPASDQTAVAAQVRILFPLPGEVMKLARGEGFQATHSKVLDPEKIQELFGL